MLFPSVLEIESTKDRLHLLSAKSLCTIPLFAPVVQFTLENKSLSSDGSNGISKLPVIYQSDIAEHQNEPAHRSLASVVAGYIMYTEKPVR